MANYPSARSAIVVDASYIVRMLLPVEQVIITLGQFTSWCQARVDICASDILVAEVTSVIRHAVYREWITAAESQLAVEDLFRLGVRIIPPDHHLCSSALTWAGRLGQSDGYDGLHFALTERLDGELWTADEKLFKAAGQIGVSWVSHAGEPLANG